MPDQMTTTGSLGGGSRKEETVSAVTDAVEALRQAMLDEGQDPATVEAKLHAVIPNTEGNLVGNYADLQRMGAIAQTGVMPTPPGEQDIETDNLADAFVEVPTAADEENGASSDVAEADDYESMTKAELQAKLDAQGIDYNVGDTKQDLIDRLG